MLPGLHGTEVLKRLRQVNTEVPVLVLTARDAVADKIANFEAGADDYLTKPFAFAELAVRVKALLRRGPSRAPTSCASPTWRSTASPIRSAATVRPSS